ncbi:SGNH/GDSL hydrolase family protein [Pseudonocardia sp. KRD-184]|uniref:SGNH/GDSL hydrolase family protein n=1 Tax=Pseudonocardia oceani TaxID=2792013 RepID=A0ABS6U501_9PSEU|nr:diglucosylglycerate octanoyltransferase [Pseudonocardia oceani]MBW0093340.1 SGNH/GDSL hydrolase family protein [Pseudonocardia oceani]MBW0099328.1 SGNH/GDSL hydrolase family protein [Pseudonocardia oceani]MBW0112450.1 SGNH/GDSL hydrolase family protein [Pseudonocardia oceani]MBW0123460.1 SGNH/GDSL hydrolase family protein [Pseudonocardia oceani]MBW0127315.1 SGNH/GDSL hydrolase family protein [Pseudonocardia oceani]
MGPRLLVFGDSLSFHGPDRAEPADEPRLWPNVAAAALGGRADLVAGIGWTARHAWHALTHDPHVWTLLPHVDVVVFGIGGMDTLPSPLPTALRELIPVLRPEGLRRRVRSGYLRAQPWLARAFARALPGGGPVALPPHLTVEYLERTTAAVRAIRPGIPVVASVPPVHRAAVYGPVHPGRPAAERAIRAWAGPAGVPLLDLRALVGDHVLGGHGNPDGMHWGWDAHAAVGRACADVVRGLLRAG